MEGVIALASETNPLEGVVDLLNTAADVAKKVSTPVNDIVNGVQSANGVVDDLQEFIGGINDTVKVAGEIGLLCDGFTEIPAVGEVLDILGSALRKFANETREFITPLNEFKQTVLDEVKRVLTKVVDVCSKVQTATNYFATRVPLWTNTIQVLYFGWQVVSVLIGLLDGTEPAHRLQSLLDSFGDIGKVVKEVYDVVSEGFQDAFNVLSVVLKPICAAVEEFAEWFSSIDGGVKKVTDVFSDIQGVIHKVEDAIAPVKWALEAIACIFDKIIQPVLDWIMHALGLDKLVDGFVDEIAHALHLDGLKEKVEGLFDLDKLNSSSTKLTDSHTKVSKVKELDTALQAYVSDPQQVLMAAILTAVSGSPVIPGSWPPPPPPLPPLNVDHSGQPSAFAVTLLAVVPRRGRQRRSIATAPLSYTASLVSFPAIASPQPTGSPTDWSDTAQFAKDVDSITTSLAPVLTLGGELQKFLAKAQQQTEIPSELHTRLAQLSELTTFLHDLSQFLQQFPIFKPFLPPLTSSLANELQAITGLDTDMSQLVQSTASLSSSLQPVVTSSSPTLTATINQLITSLGNWKSQAEKYRDQLQHGYDMDKGLGGKFEPRLNALSMTYHQRLASLQSILTQVQDLAKKSGEEGSTIAKGLEAVCSQFDKVDPFVGHLEEGIEKVAQVSHFAAKLDAIFKPLQWMLDQHPKCVGDVSDIKSNSLKLFSSISEDPILQKDFQEIYNELLNEFFPVQTLDALVKDAESIVQATSATVTATSPDYLQTLQSIEKLQVGKNQFTYYNKKTGKSETIDSHFFTDAEVKECLQLGQDMSAASGQQTEH